MILCEGVTIELPTVDGVSTPKRIGSGIRMIQFLINRAGTDLPASRRRELEKAKRIVQAKAKKEKS
jgi:Protein of unknown function (DUF3175)